MNGWVAIFTVRAVHLELVYSLSKASIMASHAAVRQLKCTVITVHVSRELARI